MSSGVEQALYLCRFIQFTTAMLLFGGSAFAFYALGGEAPEAAAGLAAFDTWFRRIALAAACLALASAFALLLCQSAAMADASAAAFDPAAVLAVLSETRFGRVWWWHLLFSVLAVLACLGRLGRWRAVVLILSMLLLASFGWVGHAAMEEGRVGIVYHINQAVHLLAAGLWLGGLPPLAWVLGRARLTLNTAPMFAVREAVRHFSQIGSVAVALIALTGVVNTAMMVGRLDALTGTAYGRLLAVKIVLFLVMVSLALLNRFRFAPQIGGDPGSLDALCRSVGLEQGLGLCILAVVSVLGRLPPAGDSG